MCENFGNSGGEGGTFWGLILENLKGRRVIRQMPSVGVVWIFSGRILVSSMIAPCCVLTGGASRSKNSM